MAQGKVFGIVLYPDDTTHRDILNYLLDEQNQCNTINPFKVLGIIHDMDKHDDGTPKKRHIHVMIEYTRKRTPDGVAKSFGGRRQVLRLYSRYSRVTGGLTREDGDLIRVFRNPDTKDMPVLIQQDDGTERPIDTEIPEFFDTKLWDVLPEAYYNQAPFNMANDGQYWKLVTVQTISHVEMISDKWAYTQYLLHETFDAITAGKHRYNKNELFGTTEFINECLGERGEMHYIELVRELFDNGIETLFGLVNVALDSDDKLFYSWLKKNTYFVQCYLTSECKRRERELKEKLLEMREREKNERKKEIHK